MYVGMFDSRNLPYVGFDSYLQMREEKSKKINK